VRACTAKLLYYLAIPKNEYYAREEEEISNEVSSFENQK